MGWANGVCSYRVQVCCGTKSVGQHGVGLPDVPQLHLHYEQGGERLMAMRFKRPGTKRGAVNFVTGYTPTRVSGDEDKQAFWEELDTLIQRKEFLCMMDTNEPGG